jgi:hypothetical protein
MTHHHHENDEKLSLHASAVQSHGFLVLILSHHAIVAADSRPSKAIPITIHQPHAPIPDPLGISDLLGLVENTLSSDARPQFMDQLPEEGRERSVHR